MRWLMTISALTGLAMAPMGQPMRLHQPVDGIFLGMNDQIAFLSSTSGCGPRMGDGALTGNELVFSEESCMVEEIFLRSNQAPFEWKGKIEERRPGWFMLNKNQIAWGPDCLVGIGEGVLVWRNSTGTLTQNGQQCTIIGIFDSVSGG